MKFLSKIFFIFSLVLFSCSTPEQKIIDSFKTGRIHKYNREIKYAEIYDTIHTQNIQDSIPIFEKRIAKFDVDMKKIDMYRDSIVNLKLPDSTKYFLIRNALDKKRRLDIQSDHLIHQKNQYYAFYNTYDSICGYYAKIYTKKDTFDFVVMVKTYNIICPTFMFTNEHLNRSRRNFN